MMNGRVIASIFISMMICLGLLGCNNPTGGGGGSSNSGISTYSLSISVTPEGQGTVEANPSGGSYTSGTTVELTASGLSGHVFSSWEGDATGITSPTHVTMTANKSIKAYFRSVTPNNYLLTISVTPDGAGVVNKSPSGPNYADGTVVTLTAETNTGYNFDHWSGSLESSSSTETILMNGSKEVTAVFTAIIPNHAPTIISLAASPEVVWDFSLFNGSAITCIATDEDNDSLTFLWSATGGTIDNNYDTSLTSHKYYYPPSVGGNYTINVTVSDGLATSAAVSVEVKTSYIFSNKWGSLGTGNGQFQVHRESNLAEYGGYLYLLDVDSSYITTRIQKFNDNGIFISKWTFPYRCEGLVVDTHGYLYANSESSKLLKFNASGTIVATIDVNAGEYFAVDSSGNIFVSDQTNNRVLKYTNSGVFIKQWGGLGTGNGNFGTGSPVGIVVDSAGNVYVSDDANIRIQKFDNNGNFLLKWTEYSEKLSVDKSNNIFVEVGHQINGGIFKKYDNLGNFITGWKNVGSNDGQITNLGGLAIDNSGNVYVLDDYTSGSLKRVQKYIPNP